jgi:hypothetical protein
VFWAEKSGIGRVGKNGGDTILTPGAGDATHVAVDADAVYWTEWSGDVRRVPRTGGQSITIGHVPNAYTIAIDATDVFFVASGTVHRVPKSGGEVKALFPGGEQGIGLAPDGIAVDDTSVYFASLFGDAIYKVPKSGGTPAVVARGPQYPRSVALDDTCVYWTTDAGVAPLYGTIMKAPK